MEPDKFSSDMIMGKKFEKERSKHEQHKPPTPTKKVQFGVSSRDLLRGKALRVAGEHGGLADIIEAKVEHRDTLEANAAAGVGRRTVAE